MTTILQPSGRLIRIARLILLFGCLISSEAWSKQDKEGAVVLRSDTLFVLKTNLGLSSARERAVRAGEVLERLLRIPDLDSSRWMADALPEWTILRYDTIAILAVSELDAKQAGMERGALADHLLSTLRTSLMTAQQETGWKDILFDLLLAAGIVAAALFALALISWFFPRVYQLIGRWEETLFHPIQIRDIKFVSSRGLLAGALIIPRTLRLLLTLAIVYYALMGLISLIPQAAEWGMEEIFLGLAKGVFVTIAAWTLIKAFRALEHLGRRSFDAWQKARLSSIRIQSVEVISRERLTQFAYGVFAIIRIGLLISLLYGYITLLFSFFAFTETWASTLFQYVTDPLSEVVASVAAFLPKLFFVMVVVFLTRFVLKVVRTVFLEVEKGTMTFSGFHREWAIPTYKIIRFLIIAFAAVIIFPYLPGSDSDAFKGISVFLGILFSLGSAGAISNVISGLVLTYMRAFQIGDRVKIGETMGDVVEKTLLITRVRTTKNVDITIPNAQVLSSHILNYSTVAADPGLILHTTVTIGYDAPWRTVHRLLIESARATKDIQQEPEPFVLQKSLDDFYVTYELNAYTRAADRMASIYSEMHQNIQDKFNEAGIEIMSPHYEAERDGDESTIPKEYPIPPRTNET